jgi:hypothetical protein
VVHQLLIAVAVKAVTHIITAQVPLLLTQLVEAVLVAEVQTARRAETQLTTVQVAEQVRLTAQEFNPMVATVFKGL